MDENIRLSVSKTKTWSHCKKQFEFSYILKLPKKIRDYHIFGNFCHRVLELFHQTYINGSTEPCHKVMTDVFKVAKLEYINKMTPDMIKECFDIIHQYLKIVSKEPKYITSVLAVEKKFETPITNNIMLNGMIDKISMDDDNIVKVSDYKTTKNKSFLKGDFFQLLTYAFVILQESPDLKKIRASYILLRHDFEEIEVEFTVDQILKIKDDYIKYATDIVNATAYPPNPSILCGWCDFLENCTAGQLRVSPNQVFGEIEW